MGGYGLDLSGSGYGLMAWYYEVGNETSASIRGKQFFHQLSDS